MDYFLLKQDGIRQGVTKQSAFSLVEVVMSLGILAIAIPTLLGVFAAFSRDASETRDHNDVKGIVNVTELYLEQGREGELIGRGGDFATVYGWAQEARLNEDSARVVYVYKPNVEDDSASEQGSSGGTEARHEVSATFPGLDEVSFFDGRIMAIEIHDAEETVLTEEDFVSDVNAYLKAYLPLQLMIYTVISAEDDRNLTNFVDSIPIVLKR